MKANLKERPQSRRIKQETASVNSRKINQEIAQENFKQAKAEQAKDHFEKAIEFYTRSVGYNPSYFQAFCNMGYCYRALSKYSEAKRCYLSSLSINRQDLISHYNLANLYRIMGQNELAIQEYSYLIDLAEKNIPVGNLYINSLINVGICYKNEAQLEQAITVYRKVIEIDPKQQDAQFNLAICLLNSIQSKNFTAFNKFYKERAIQADQLFRKILQKNQKNYMVKLCLIKTSAFLDNSQKNIEEGLAKLKQLLEVGECDVKDEIREQIARILSHLQQFQESSKYYQDSLSRKIAFRGKMIEEESNKVEALFGQFQLTKVNSYNQEQFFTEAEGIMMIEEGRFIETQLQIQKIQEKNRLKHSLQIMLYIKQAEESEDSQYIEKAIKVYKQHFDKTQSQLPFSKLSLETHKAIGKLLNLDGRYQKSIKHYQYISQRLKNDRKCASAKLFNDLGEGFEETGDYPRALEQYKRAIEIEPDNYGLTYNMAYCLYQSGHLKEATDCFANILENIKKNSILSESIRQLYQTDCMIMLGLSNVDQQKNYELFSVAFKKFQKLKENEGTNLQPLQENLLIFLIEASETYQKKLKSLTSTDHEFKPIAEGLLQIYSALLDLEECPDADEILINCGNIYYQLHRFAAATHSYEQVKKSHLVPQINIALTYAHLIQPVIASKHMKHACTHFPQDLANKFCSQILQWMYFSERGGDWNRHLPLVNWDMFYERNQYGLALIDKLTESINKAQLSNSQLTALLTKIVKNSQSVKFKQQSRNIKFEKIKSLIEKYDLGSQNTQTNILNSAILKICFTTSNNISEDFIKLTDLLCNIPKCGRQSSFCQAAIHFFIYSNKVQSLKLRQCLQQFVKKQKQRFIINTAQFDQINSSIYADFKNIKQFVLTLKEWEAVLDSQIVPYLQAIEEVYYCGKIRKPIELEYHFPRSHNLLEKDQTFQKVIFIVLSIIKYDSAISCKGRNVGEMRQDLIKQFQHRFNIYLEKANLQLITLSNSFLPLTLYCTHESKEDCLAFANEVSRRMKGQTLLEVNGEQLQVIIDRLVRIRCRWNDPYSVSSIVKQVAEGITDNPMFIVNQSIIYLQKIRKVIKKDSQQAKKYISLDSSFNY